MVTSYKGLMQCFLLAFLLSYLSADDAVQRLPFCNPNYDELRPNYDLFIVSSLDGKLSAFSASEGGKLWELETDSLLSSNVHHIELTSEGKWARLVPSLRGSLYRLTGESLEALPLDAEQLLSSSYKYSDDLVIAGARETVWRGLEVSSGRIIYECNSRGCNKEQSSKSETVGDMLVLRQNSYTIRALDPRTGYEKWNFSVAEHQLSQSDSAECDNEVFNLETEDVEMNVVLPDGIICMHPVDKPLEIVWKQKLEAPVAAAWRLQGRTLKQLDVLSLGSRPIVPHDSDHQTPALYIGMHNHQLYIQESQHRGDDNAVVKKSSRTPHAIAWRPKPARLQIETSQVSNALEVVSERDLALTALHTLYSKPQRVNPGYFLYEDMVDITCDQNNVSQESLDDQNNSDVHHVHVHVYSLWFWWKEVLLIAISSALLMNLMIWPRIVAGRARPSTPLQLNQEYIVVERHIEQPPMPKMIDTGKNDVYNSRYLADFTPLRCLGRGGFGVVFEAKNNIDDCSYAVKRITLPKRQSKRERVLREVRALAKLEHDHIVRYFNAWLEEPPFNWQEQQDAQWIKDFDGISALITSEKRHSESSQITMNVNNELVEKKSTLINLERPTWDKSLDECFDALDYNNLDQSKEENKISKRSRSFSCNDSFSIVFDEHAPEDTRKINCSSNNDSFIVFEENYDTEAKSGTTKKNHQTSEINSDLKSASRPEINYHPGVKKSHRRVSSLDLSVKSSSMSLSKMYLYIQMQLCQRDSLHDWLRHNSSHETRKHQVIYLFSQIVSAVEYVHLAGLIHRDLKPSNIFFAPDGKIKIGDFGLVTAMSDQSTNSEGDCEHRHEKDRGDIRHTYKVGTHLYMSPEQLQGHPYSYKVDIYSLGLILFELLQPFNTESERINSLLKLREGEYPYLFQDKFPKESESLKLMLSNDPAHRPTACGVKARAPLCQPCDPQWHFKMPSSPLSS